jgi:hypothetical protein
MKIANVSLNADMIMMVADETEADETEAGAAAADAGCIGGKSAASALRRLT